MESRLRFKRGTEIAEQEKGGKREGRKEESEREQISVA